MPLSAHCTHPHKISLTTPSVWIHQVLKENTAGVAHYACIINYEFEYLQLHFLNTDSFRLLTSLALSA